MFSKLLEDMKDEIYYENLHSILSSWTKFRLVEITSFTYKPNRKAYIATPTKDGNVSYNSKYIGYASFTKCCDTISVKSTTCSICGKKDLPTCENVIDFFKCEKYFKCTEISKGNFKIKNRLVKQSRHCSINYNIDESLAQYDVLVETKDGVIGFHKKLLESRGGSIIESFLQDIGDVKAVINLLSKYSPRVNLAFRNFITCGHINAAVNLVKLHKFAVSIKHELLKQYCEKKLFKSGDFKAVIKLRLI